MSRATDCIVLGATGYVGAELVRLIASHPQLRLAGVVSDSRAGAPLAEVLPHLAGVCGDSQMLGYDALPRLLGETDIAAVFAAAPHGAAAERIDALLTTAQRTGTTLHVADTSADFRFRTAQGYAAVYGHAHGAPQWLERFVCAVPEHLDELPDGHFAHPGCFVTAVLLALVPMLRAGAIVPQVYVTGITGSTGSGRTPGETTHHPFRHANLFAYKPLTHRHAPEIVELATAATATRPQLSFVPHSGPFARGIHVTLHATLARPASAEELVASCQGMYRSSPFIQVGSAPPRLKDVVGSNRCHLGIAVDGDQVVVLSVIDNLIKGAAGGAVQWMNRRLGYDQSAGLTTPAIGWS